MGKKRAQSTLIPLHAFVGTNMRWNRNTWCTALAFLRHHCL